MTRDTPPPPRVPSRPPGRQPRARLRVARRGQLVLVAAGLVAVALVPMTLAYLQLGYDADVQASGDLDAPAENAERLLSRGVHEAAVTDGRSVERAVERTRDGLAPWLDRLRESRVADGVAYRVSYDDRAAREWADRACPGGEGRAFGPCRVRDGVVVQERAGAVHTVAVAVEVTVVTGDGETRLTTVVRAVGGPA